MRVKTLIVNNPFETEVLVERGIYIAGRPYLAIYLPIGANIRETEEEVILGRLEALDEAEVVE